MARSCAIAIVVVGTDGKDAAIAGERNAAAAAIAGSFSIDVGAPLNNLNGGVVGDRGAAQICSVIALAVLNGIGVVGTGWIGVGNGECVPAGNGPGDCQLNGGAGDGNSGDGIGNPA